MSYIYPYPVGYKLEQRYTLESFLARTPQGTWYAARDTDLGRRLLVKHFRSCSEPENRNIVEQRFYRESRIFSLVSHQAIPRLYSTFACHDGLFHVFEHIDGVPLDHLLRKKGKFPAEEALAIARELMEVLSYLHRLDPPVIVRDLHPGSLMIKDNRVALVNFGQAVQGTSSVSDDSFPGIPGYTPPWRYQDKFPPSPLDDVYAAGVILHQMLTGFNPQQLPPGDRPPRLQDIDPSLPGQLSNLLERAFTASPGGRFFSATQFLAGLTVARSIQEDAFLCTGCNRANPSGSLICSFCGTPVVEPKNAGTSTVAVTVRPPKFPRKPAAESTDPLLYPLALMASRPLGFDNLLTIDHNEIDEFPHQIQAVRRALKNMGGRCLLADEVGLGKTIEAGIIMAELLVRGLVKNILVITPAHLRFQWKEELHEKFRESFKVYTSPRSVNLTMDERIIISYDAVSRRGPTRETLVNRKWDLIIVDEAHHARNNKTLRWKFLDEVKNDYILLLSATPVQNHLSDLFNLVTLLRPGHLANSREFKKEFVDPANPRRPKNPEALRRLMAGVMIRTRRADALITFPRRIAATKVVSLTRHERELYNETITFIRSLAGKQDDRLPLGLMHVAQRITSSPAAASATLLKMSRNEKLFSPEECAQWHRLYLLAREIVEPAKVAETLRILSQVQDRVVLFTDHVPTQDYLAQYFAGLQIPTAIYRGTAQQKQDALQQFKKEARVLITSQAGGEGLNLQGASNILINYDLPWNPMRLEQRIGRLQRLGQTRDVFVFNLVGEDTVEAYILRVLEEKIRMFQLSVGQLDLILGTRFEEEGSFEQLVWKKLIAASAEKGIGEQILAIGDELEEDLDNFEKIQETGTVLDELSISE